MEQQPSIGKQEIHCNSKNRAAEVGTIECAKILLDNSADIDALNYTGQTAFHVVTDT